MAGGGGSSASSTTTEYPAYMEDIHKDWLNKTGTDTIYQSITETMSSILSSPPPHTGINIVNVDAVFFSSGIYASYTSPFAAVKALEVLALDTLYNGYIADRTAQVDAVITAESALQTNELETRVLPRFQAGMLDINAVQSSAFVLGSALLYDGKAKVVAKNSASMRLAALDSSANIALQRLANAMEQKRLHATAVTELSRIYTGARKEIDNFELDLRVKSATFPLTVFQYGANMLGSIAGAAVSPTDLSSGNSALSGAMSGAMAGAVMGSMVPGVGTVAGAAIGGIAGYFMNS